MFEAEVMPQSTAIARVERSSILLMPVMDVDTARGRLAEFQRFVEGYMQESHDGGNDGGDFGTIPGAGKKKILFKQGADKLAEIYGLYDQYDIKATIDWDRGLFDYEVTCSLRMRRDDSLVGTGVGCCSSYESKYRWRDQNRKCTQCGKENIRKSKPRGDGTGGGWYCWAKTGGCGATFKDGDKTIEGQAMGRVENPDIHDIKNTVLKMAKKRAKVDAVIGVTRSSGIFTQDVEDLEQRPGSAPPEPEVSTERKTYTKPQPQDRPASGEDTIKGKTPEQAATRISTKQAQTLHMRFKEACPDKAHADDYLYAWLQSKEFVIDGKPTAMAIPADRFAEVGKAAMEYAASVVNG